VELSQNSSFSNPQIVHEVAGNSTLIQNLREGSRWWRVILRYQRGDLRNPLNSQPRYFVLERRIKHEAVKLISPMENAVSSLDVRDGISLRWLAAGDIVSYRISVARNRNMMDIAAVGDGPENWKSLLPDPKAAVCYWRIEGIAADEADVPVSGTRSFTVRPRSRIVELIDPAPRREAESFSFHNFICAAMFQAPSGSRLSKTEDEGGRSRIIDALLQAESFTIMLPGEGEYVWNIQILDDRAVCCSEAWIPNSFRGRNSVRRSLAVQVLVRLQELPVPLPSP